MKCNLAIKTVVALVFVQLLGCDKDIDTPPELKRESYVDARMLKAGSETVVCDGKSFNLPTSETTETFAQYILKIHAANRKSVLADMNIGSAQEIYRKCLRPVILKRLSKPQVD